MTAHTEHKLCRCCDKYKAYRDGLCWGCHNEVKHIDHEFSNFGDDAEDIGYGKVQQARAEKNWK